jgi:hypothetical protein
MTRDPELLIGEVALAVVALLRPCRLKPRIVEMNKRALVLLGVWAAILALITAWFVFKHT